MRLAKGVGAERVSLSTVKSDWGRSVYNQSTTESSKTRRGLSKYYVYRTFKREGRVLLFLSRLQ